MVDIPKRTSVTINGVDVSTSNYVISWKIEREFGDDIGEIDITLAARVRVAIAITEQSIGDEVVVRRGPVTGSETIVFRGEVTTVTPNGATISIRCADRLYEARRSKITKSFDMNIDPEAGVVSEIFKTLINDYTPLTCNSTTVQTSTVSLRKFICNNADVLERLSVLAKNTGWQFLYNPVTDLVYFEPLGFVDNGATLTVGVDVVEVPTWTHDSALLANKLVVIGAEQEVETTEAFDGDGVTTDFVLGKSPISVKIYVGGVLQVGGNDSTSTGYDYAVDKETNTISFQAGSVPAAGSGNVSIAYSYMLPSPVTGKRQSSIDAYGEYPKSMFKLELKKREDAQAFLNSYLDQYASPFSQTKLKLVSAAGHDPGETIEVVDDFNQITRTVIITKSTMQYPYKSDELEVGDKVLRLKEWLVDLNDRVRRLEEEMGQTQDLLLHVIDLFREPVTLQRRYFKLQTHNVLGSFILGNATEGLLANNPLGAVSAPTLTKRLIPGGLDFQEYLYDTEFINTSASTATIDTSNQRIHS
jgi:hypothetical protein